ncbi:hypothetical protein CANARDRAFT_25481 [[Candida] arabinofermentans NRRL YB-2248]|uniref:Conserved oligomeric Golgi complex subunit 1 n=1 Tax=[Candida] arabinofermentans NRRL YB-2248 TaxID=983967 RepID=A0A1E4SU10_9ASCO|nr:hypothetical protein CANARDRAFT_25481 [[Candida] arabinofermentans NRRL YB-2248]
MDLDISKLLNSSVDELFSTYSIQQLKQLKYQLHNDVNFKKEELRNLVGFKYRDLLKVADDIIKMNDLTSIENDKLIQLTFKKSNYNNNKLGNLINFNKFDKIEKVQSVLNNNKHTILRNFIHDLNYSISNLNLGQLNENNDDLNEYSIKFIEISKQFLIIEQIFAKELTTDNFTTNKFKSLKENFLLELENQIINLNDNEFEFLINILISYIIVNIKSPLDSLKWFLNQRLRKIQLIDEQQLQLDYYLTYNYNTLSYLNIFKNKLITILIRLIGNSNSWLVTNVSYKKWVKWLPNKTIQFPLTLTEIRSSINESLLQTNVDDYKLKIGNLLYNSIEFNLNEINDLNSSVSYLNKILMSFKLFTSLYDLKYDKGDLIFDLLKLWKDKSMILLTDDLNQFNKVSELIISNYNNFENSLISTNNGLNLFKFNDLSNIDIYLNSNMSLGNSIDLILKNLVNFQNNLNLILNSLNTLNKLSTNLNKPILTIDDYENDSFWKEISDKINEFISNSINFNIKKLNKSIEIFFKDLIKLINKDDESVKLFYMIRILIQLSDKIDIISINNKFSKFLNSNSNTNQLDLNALIDPLLKQLFKQLVNHISEPYKKELKSLIVNRFNTNDSDDDYPEIILWETTTTTTTNNNLLIPNSASLNFENLIYRLSCNLVSINENKSEDYTDIYLISQFNSVKLELIDDLIKIIEIPLVKPTIESLKVGDIQTDEMSEVETNEKNEPLDTSEVQTDEKSEPLDEKSVVESDEKSEIASDNEKSEVDLDEEKSDVDVESEIPLDTSNIPLDTSPPIETPLDTSPPNETPLDNSPPPLDNSESVETSVTPSITTAKILLAYSDLVFLNCFKLNELNESELSKLLDQKSNKDIINKLNEFNLVDLKDDEYIKSVNKLIIEHFKSCRLMFGVLN